jgi:hypothetical protein
MLIIHLKDEQLLRHYLDNSNSSFVTPSKFSEFLSMFGSLEFCMNNVLSKPFYYSLASAVALYRPFDRFSLLLTPSV